MRDVILTRRPKRPVLQSFPGVAIFPLPGEGGAFVLFEVAAKAGGSAS